MARALGPRGTCRGGIRGPRLKPSSLEMLASSLHPAGEQRLTGSSALVPRASCVHGHVGTRHTAKMLHGTLTVT